MLKLVKPVYFSLLVFLTCFKIEEEFFVFASNGRGLRKGVYREKTKFHIEGARCFNVYD